MNWWKQVGLIRGLCLEWYSSFSLQAKGMVTRLYCSKYNIPLHSCEIVLTATGNLNQSTGEIHQLFEIKMNVDADIGCWLAKFEKFVEDQCAIGTLLKQENEVKTIFNLRSKS